MTDRAMIRLHTTLEAARLQDSPLAARVVNHKGIIIRSDEVYLQTTNVADPGIALDGEFTAHTIDCAGNVVLDITANVGIFEFTDPQGLPQMQFEIAYVPNNAGRFIRITATGSNAMWYSNEVEFSDRDKDLTTLVQYRGYGYDDNLNTDYKRAPHMNCVRLMGLMFTDIPDEQTAKGYDMITTGQKVTSRVMIYEMDGYVFEYATVHTLRALNRILAQDILYINGRRCTNKPYAKPGGRLGASTLFKTTFEASIDRADTIGNDLQIISPMVVVSRVPSEPQYTLELFESATEGNLVVTFSTPITSAPTSVDVYIDGVFSEAVSATIDGDSLLFDYTPTANGVYWFVFGEVSSFFGTFAGYGVGEWEVEIVPGEYDADDYDNDEYLIS